MEEQKTYHQFKSPEDRAEFKRKMIRLVMAMAILQDEPVKVVMEQLRTDKDEFFAIAQANKEELLDIQVAIGRGEICPEYESPEPTQSEG